MATVRTFEMGATQASFNTGSLKMLYCSVSSKNIELFNICLNVAASA